MSVYSIAGVRAIYEVTSGSVWMKLCASVGMMLFLMGWRVLSVLWTIISGKLPNTPPWALVEVNTFKTLNTLKILKLNVLNKINIFLSIQCY